MLTTINFGIVYVHFCYLKQSRSGYIKTIILPASVGVTYHSKERPYIYGVSGQSTEEKSGPNIEEVIKALRKLHNEKRRKFYSSRSISRVIR